MNIEDCKYLVLMKNKRISQVAESPCSVFWALHFHISVNYLKLSMSSAVPGLFFLWGEHPVEARLHIKVAARQGMVKTV